MGTSIIDRAFKHLRLQPNKYSLFSFNLRFTVFNSNLCDHATCIAPLTLRMWHSWPVFIKLNQINFSTYAAYLLVQSDCTAKQQMFDIRSAQKVVVNIFLQSASYNCHSVKPQPHLQLRHVETLIKTAVNKSVLTASILQNKIINSGRQEIYFLTSS